MKKELIKKLPIDDEDTIRLFREDEIVEKVNEIIDFINRHEVN